MNQITNPPDGPMTEERFFKTLQDLTRRKPFLPFIVELLDSRRIVVDYPSVAFSGGAAGFITDNGLLERFTCEEVRSISLATSDASR